jgi:hypothetical protein
VNERLSTLGCNSTSDFAILPLNFENVTNIDEFRHASEAATVRTLFRNGSIPLTEIIPSDKKPAYVQNNAFEWLAPTLFVSSALISSNPNLIAIALGVIANYATDFFKGFTGKPEVKIEIVVEKTKTRTCKKISYQGTPEGLANLSDVIKGASNE